MKKKLITIAAVSVLFVMGISAMAIGTVNAQSNSGVRMAQEVTLDVDLQNLEVTLDIGLTDDTNIGVGIDLSGEATSTPVGNTGSGNNTGSNSNNSDNTNDSNNIGSAQNGFYGLFETGADGETGEEGTRVGFLSGLGNFIEANGTILLVALGGLILLLLLFKRDRSGDKK